MHRFSLFIIAPIVLGVSFFIWAYLYVGQLNFFGAVAGAQPSITWFGLVGGYLATVLGVFIGAGYRHLAGDGIPTGQIENIKVMLLAVIKSKDFWTGLFASPLVFGIIFKTVDGLSLSGLVVIALENGFFCHFVIKELINSKNN